MKTKFERGVNGLAIKLLPETEQEKILLQEFTQGRRKGKSKHIVSLLKEGGLNGIKVEKKSVMRNQEVGNIFGNQDMYEPAQSVIKFLVFYGRSGDKIYFTCYGAVRYVCIFMVVDVDYLANAVGGGTNKAIPALVEIIDTMTNKTLRGWQKITYNNREMMVKVVGKFRTVEEFDALGIPNNLQQA